MISFLIYLWGVSGVLHLLLAATLLMSSVVVGILSIGILVENDKPTSAQRLKALLKIPARVLIASIVLTIFIPSQKTIAMMYVVPKVVDSKVVQEDMSDLYNIGVNVLKKKLEGLAEGETGGKVK